jgi:hypothetical protein
MTWYRASPSQEPRPQRAGLVGVLSDDPVDQGLGVLCDPSLDVERCKGEKPVDQSAAEDRLLEWGHGRHCHSETKTH